MRCSALALLLALSCAPDLGPGDSLVEEPRILAVRADPAEAPPGTRVTFTPLVATPTGAATSPAVAWAFCEAPRPLTTDDSVSTACLGGASLVPAGEGSAVTAKTPANGCSLFGPDSPPGGFRPTDPDVTGGYYQPLRAELAGATAAFELARIRCDLANASATAVSQFTAAYHANENPTLNPVGATVGAAPASLTAIPAGARATFTASWPAASAETFAYYDASSDTVTTQRESMRVAWYSTAGAFDTESTGRAASDPATTTDDGWTAPSSPGLVHLWIVLRDSRGGVDFAAYDVSVVQ